MKVMGEYYKELNRSYDAMKTHKAWTGYRSGIDTWRGPSTGGRVAIVGAGNLNDLNLKSWLDENVDLHLFDADQQAMKNGVDRQAWTGKVAYHQVEFTGLDDKNFFEELSVLMAHQDITGIERFLENTKVEPDWTKESDFDSIIITPIYTQLVLGQVMTMIEHYRLEPHQKRLVPAVLKFMAQLIDQVNSSLLKLLKGGGQCYAWSDILEYHSSHVDFERIACMDQKQLKQLVHDYEKSYGQGIGNYGIANLCSHLAHEKDSHYLTWPFDDKRLMVVELIRGVVTA
ncbi:MULTISPECIES: hypothetical protein [unclassified Fusibacter]|uniref:hypothetical protein n=1 Tax=unclassified Fusibacter TaxID=2624464 RepID=UPI001013C040|nr:MULTISPECIES: hypothetical protein [unclassified Fusibacter]MCK8060050.1 hypothetical protein [Fusibacter sp. A2]NPE22192.1 hypothetical protein [Fusibacter sp. A1]RXV60968.1 hypothetical protein DWB64_10125 [Fusibacter sp. A1]